MAYAGQHITILGYYFKGIQDIELAEVYIEINSVETQLDNYVIDFTDTSTEEGATRVSNFAYAAQIPEGSEIGDEIRWRFSDVYGGVPDFYYPSAGVITVGERQVIRVRDKTSIYIGIAI